MYLKLQGKVEIIGRADGANPNRKLSFISFHSIEIELDIFKINSTCKIKIPTIGRLSSNGVYALNSVQTAREFERGDRITVWLGYNGKLDQEFTGFIYRINYTSPLEIECEGYEFQLRKVLETKTWRKTTIIEVLKYLTAGTDIILSPNIQDIEFDKFVVPAGSSALQELQKLKEETLLEAYFDGNVLYMGMAYAVTNGTVKYRLGWNTIKDNDLKYRNADDVQVKVKAIYLKPDGQKVEVSVGDPDGKVEVIKSKTISGEAALKGFAQSMLQKFKYSGYEGKITAFLWPFAKPTMAGQLDDPKYNERKGTYYITSTKVKADRNGGRRTTSFTIKL